MRASRLLFTLLLMSLPAYAAAAGEQAPSPDADTRYPVQVKPEEAVHQKNEMRGNLIALRDTIDKLADKDFAGVEKALRRLSHTGPGMDRPGAKTKAFRDLEKGFEASVDKTIEAARSGDTQVVLRSLAKTMGYCQSCHMSFRENLESTTEPPAAPAAPAAAPAAAPPAEPGAATKKP